MTLSSQVLKVSEGGDSPTSLAGFNHSYLNLFFFLYLLRIFLGAACGCCLLPFGCAPLREVWLHLACRTPLSSWRSRSDPPPPPAFPSPDWANPISSAPPWMSYPVALQWTWSNMLVPFTGETESGHDRVLQTWPHSASGKRISPSLKLPGALLQRQPGMCLACIASRAHCSLVFNNFTSGPAPQSCSLTSRSPACSVAGASSVRVKDPAFVLLNFVMFLSARKYSVCNISKSITPSSRGRSFLCGCLWVLTF